MTVAEINKLIQELPSEERGKVNFTMQKEQIQQLIYTLEDSDIGSLNDKFHSFSELYEFRKIYNAALFNNWAKMYYYNLEMKEQGFNIDMDAVTKSCFDVHKSWRHHDGELCFGGDWFIVVAVLPTGQISNHYHSSDWDLFKIPEVEKAKYEFDGHSSGDVLNRLKSL